MHKSHGIHRIYLSFGICALIDVYAGYLIKIEYVRV